MPLDDLEKFISTLTRLPPQDTKQTRTKVPDDQTWEGIITTFSRTGLTALVHHFSWRRLLDTLQHQASGQR